MIEENIFFNLMGETPLTTVNGPGNRYMIHLQGCPCKCPGCFSPESWSFKIKNQVEIKTLADKILNSNAEALTISGGEPFAQASSLLAFLQYLHKNGSCPFKKGIIVFSGFYETELMQIPEYNEILRFIDVIVSGRFDQNLRIYNSLLSSSNQKFIWGARQQILIKEKELMHQECEVIIEDDKLKLTGFPPSWDKKLILQMKELGIDFDFS